MRWRKTESFGFDRQTGVAERRTRLTFQLNEMFRQTLIRSYSHSRHVGNKIAIGKDELRSENLRSDFKTLIQIRLIAIRDPEISIAKEVFQLVGHGEDHRITRQSFRKHHRGADFVVDERAAQISEPVGPFIDFDSVLCVDSPQVAGEHTW